MNTTLSPNPGLTLGEAATSVWVDRLPHKKPEGLARQREYLKALRRAELVAWQSRGGRIEPGADPIRRARVELARQKQSDAWFFAVAIGIAATALVFAFRDSIDITQHWADFARFVQQLLG